MTRKYKRRNQHKLGVFKTFLIMTFSIAALVLLGSASLFLLNLIVIKMGEGAAWLVILLAGIFAAACIVEDSY